MPFVIADGDGIVRIARDADENDDRSSFGQALLQGVNAPTAGFGRIPVLRQNICDAVCRDEAKGPFQFRKQRFPVRIFSEAPQEIGGSIGRAFPISLTVDAGSCTGTEEFGRIIKAVNFVLWRAYVRKKTDRRSEKQDEHSSCGGQAAFSYLYGFCI